MKTLRSLFLTLCLTGAAVAGAFGTLDARAAELIMLERPGCGWCARWDREIAPIYPLTDEGREAPLRRIDMSAPWPSQLSTIAADRYTPTFILVDNGIEISRLRGYPGEMFFWPMLGEMLAKLPETDRK